MFKKEKEFYDEKIQEHKNKAEALAVELEECRSQIDELNKEKNVLLKCSKENAKLLDEINSLKVEKKELEGDLKRILEKLDEAKEANDKLTDEKEAMETKMLKKFNEYVSYQAKVESLTEDLKERKLILSEVQKENKDSNKKIGAMEVDIKTLNRYIDDKNKEVAEKDLKIQNFEEETRDLKERMTRLELERADLIKKVEKYEKLL